MNDTIPKSKITRTISSSKIVVKMGTKHLGHLLKKPFLSKEKQILSQEKKDIENAQILFKGLSMLRGTALKAAQMLSFESDIIPESIRKELEKSYNQVPPINRALVRKIIINNFNTPPENVFKSFDSKAFAAASLGQVHFAKSKKGEDLAVKIQYPDISKTISNDIRLLKTILRPMPEYGIIKIALEEIEAVLLNETDYEKEGQNIEFFRKNLKNDQVIIPRTYPDLMTENVLSMSCMKGQILTEWLAMQPGQESKTHVAQIMHDIFVEGFYELKQIHADPNPGNFLVTDDLKICLLDFGCVREFDEKFIHLYQRLIRIGSSKDKEAYVDLLTQMKLMTPELDKHVKDQMVELFMQMGDWFSQLFKEEEFDFGANPDFMERGKKIGHQMHQFRKHIHNITPEFVFLDRTRYGLIKLFEKMKVKIKIQNKYEH
ncbi:MAG: AarF/ABC1/UbiB kinase family protein [Desulfobacteraceae bacterium]|nr:AarF/ABC1/UbiB kinase family protein [Desulfobacteraceae bacterium]